MCSMIWNDKQPVPLLSTHAPPITNGDPMTCTVLKRDGGNRSFIPTSLVLFEYTIHMLGLDVVNQL